MCWDDSQKSCSTCNGLFGAVMGTSYLSISPAHGPFDAGLSKLGTTLRLMILVAQGEQGKRTVRCGLRAFSWVWCWLLGQA